MMLDTNVNAAKRVLIVGESLKFRKLVRDALARVPQVEVVSTVSSELLAVDLLPGLRPDIVIGDGSVPQFRNAKILNEIRQRKLRVSVVAVVPHNCASSPLLETTLQSSDFACVTMPHTNESADQIQLFSESLERTFANMAKHPKIGSANSNTTTTASHLKQVRIIVVGVSTGGPQALEFLLPALPDTLSLPIVVVQHMPREFTGCLATELDGLCPHRSVLEAEDGMRVLANHIYIAPGGYQTKLVRRSGISYLSVKDEPPEGNCKPSVDYLFRSVAEVYPDDAIGLVLTGMGNDGTEGCRLMKASGSRIIAQEESSCIVYGMPRSVVRAGLADAVVPLQEMPNVIELAVEGVELCL